TKRVTKSSFVTASISDAGNGQKSATLPTDGYHRARGGQETRLVDAMPFSFLRDDVANPLANFAVGRAVSQQRSQIVIVLAEEAGPQFAVGGQADARAESTKGLRHRRNQADLAAPVGEPVLARRLAAFMRHRHQRPLRRNPPVDFLAGNEEFA